MTPTIHDTGRFCQITGTSKLNGRTGIIVGFRTLGTKVRASVKLTTRDGVVTQTCPQYLVPVTRLNLI